MKIALAGLTVEKDNATPKTVAVAILFPFIAILINFYTPVSFSRLFDFFHAASRKIESQFFETFFIN